MTFDDTELLVFLSAWYWPFVRIAALVTAAPVFGARSVPARVKLGVAVVLTLAIAPVIPPMPAIAPFSAAGLVVTAQQVLVGLAMGLALRLVFVVLEVGGQQIAQLSGLGFASLVDPRSGFDVPLVSQFYVVFATLVFLALNGHLVMVEALAASFHTFPVQAAGLERAALWGLVSDAGWVFSAAVVMALPAIVALLTVNLCFGVITRTAPQLNIFAVGFPVSLLFGFVIMLLTLPAIVGQLPALYDRGFQMLYRLVGA